MHRFLLFDYLYNCEQYLPEIKRGPGMYARHLEEAEPFTCADIQFGMLLPGEVTGSVEVVWERLEPLQCTPADHHSTFDQLFFILNGTGMVTLGTESRPVKAGTLVLIPRGTQHSVHCTSRRT